MGTQGPRTVVLDTGALIALERGNQYVSHLLRVVQRIHIPAGALGQAWRDPRRQVRLARTVNSDGVIIHPLDEDAAKAAGRLCARAGTADIVDASVVQVARLVNAMVLTSDPDDLRRLAPELEVVVL